MKEKTFDELALELASARFWDNGDDFVKTAANLMQQVREATIAECVEILQNPNIPKSRMESLPTDRIKTEK